MQNSNYALRRLKPFLLTNKKLATRNEKANKITAFLCFIIFLSLAQTNLFAISLWSDTKGSLLTDARAKYVGDNITIIVNETTSASQRASTQIKQEEKQKTAKPTGLIGQFLEPFGIQGSDQYKVDGDTNESGTLRTQITAQVKEVLPNGNLLIEARRSIVVNKETQTVVLTGVIRPIDIATNNTILSSFISNMQIRYEGKGDIAKRQKVGILSKIFDIIF